MASKRSNIIVVVLFAAALVTTLAAHGAKASDHKLTMAYAAATKGTNYAKVAELLSERIKAATKGKVEIIINDSLVKAPQLAQSVRDGRVQMADVISVYYSAAHPELAIATLPGLINNLDQLKAVFDAFWRDDLDALFAKKYNSRVLYWGLHCPQMLMSRIPIKTVDDFVGKKIRVHNVEAGALMDAIGGKPTPMPVSEILPALQRGIIDGVITNWCLAFGQGYYNVAKYLEYWPLTPIIPFPVLINRDVWKKLPEDVRQAMVETCRKMEQESFNDYNAGISNMAKEWEAKGGEYFRVPEAEGNKLFQKKYIEPVYQSYYDRARKMGFDGKAYVDRALKAMGRTSVD
jgi:TRAP-type C4-dicarboxylate transport system substrate-binding protein